MFIPHGHQRFQVEENKQLYNIASVKISVVNEMENATTISMVCWEICCCPNMESKHNLHCFISISWDTHSNSIPFPGVC